MSLSFSHGVAPVIVCRNSFELNEVIFNPVLETEVFDVEVSRAFRWLLCICRHEKSSLVIFVEDCGGFLSESDLLKNGMEVEYIFTSCGCCGVFCLCGGEGTCCLKNSFPEYCTTCYFNANASDQFVVRDVAGVVGVNCTQECFCLSFLLAFNAVVFIVVRVILADRHCANG